MSTTTSFDPLSAVTAEAAPAAEAAAAGRDGSPRHGGGAADVPRSRAYCEAVARGRASNFYYGMRLVPEPKRSATYALYAWLREADDLADGEGEPAEKAGRLDQFWKRTEQIFDAGRDGAGHGRGAARDDADCFWPLFQDVAWRYRLSPATLREHLSGQLLDQRKTRYATFDELYDYCRRVASTVGLLCIDIWGHDGAPATRQLAEWRGVAFQLTNILRDVREDALRGRVYLPQDAAPEAITPEGVCSGAAAGPMLASSLRLIARAREYYERSAPLEGMLHPDGRACLRAMTAIYRGVFERIERDPRLVLSPTRVSLPRWRKLLVALRAVTG